MLISHRIRNVPTCALNGWDEHAVHVSLLCWWPMWPIQACLRLCSYKCEISRLLLITCFHPQAQLCLYMMVNWKRWFFFSSFFLLQFHLIGYSWLCPAPSRGSVGPNVMYVFYPCRPSTFPDNFRSWIQNWGRSKVQWTRQVGTECPLKKKKNLLGSHMSFDQAQIYVFPSSRYMRPYEQVGWKINITLGPGRVSMVGVVIATASCVVVHLSPWIWLIFGSCCKMIWQNEQTLGIKHTSWWALKNPCQGRVHTAGRGTICVPPDHATGGPHHPLMKGNMRGIISCLGLGEKFAWRFHFVQLDGCHFNV